MSCLREVKTLQGEAAKAPPSAYKAGYEDALREVTEELEEIECLCNEPLMDDSGEDY